MAPKKHQNSSFSRCATLFLELLLLAGLVLKFWKEGFTLFPAGKFQFGHLFHHLNEPQVCWLEKYAEKALYLQKLFLGVLGVTQQSDSCTKKCKPFLNWLLLLLVYVVLCIDCRWSPETDCLISRERNVLSQVWAKLVLLMDSFFLRCMWCYCSSTLKNLILTVLAMITGW